jgi:transcriptional regulator with XRE-family HTH domain
LAALALVLIIGKAERSGPGKQVESYLGLMPLEESSGNRRWQGHITKQGSSMLSFLLVEFTVNQVSVDSAPFMAMLNSMPPKNVGSFLGDLRKKQRRSLYHIAKRIGKKGISKQALSLIERGRMRVPKARLSLLRRAYRLSAADEKELARLYAFEMMIEDTGEDREFGEALLSVLNPEMTNSMYVIGGRKLALASPILQEKAARFLEGEGNSLSFFYPIIDAGSSSFGLWHHNTERERFELREAIRAFSSKSIARKIRFIEIDTRMVQTFPIALQLLSLCGPFTTTTIAGSVQLGHAAGYIYVEGPKERWVLLKPEQARRAAMVLTSALKAASVGHGPFREQLDP